VIITRSGSCRFGGLDEAAGRVNLDDLPARPRRTAASAEILEIPLVYVVSRGNRDVANMGYKVALDALLRHPGSRCRL